MKIITKTADLDETCKRLAKNSSIAVDTEFMRETTFWPQLCLIQIASPNDEVIIDPLSEQIALDPFWELMANSNVMKVFHSARQDIEIVYNMGKIIPEPMFDTQIAAMVCGFGDCISYENIVRRISGASIDKTSQFTDWSRRPLSDKQLKYALSDVTHLRNVYKSLRKTLNKSGREAWLEEEMKLLTSPQTYLTDPEHAWKRSKFKARNKKILGVFMSVAAWREQEAQERNVPRNRILKEEAMRELAMQAPVSPEALEKLRTISRGFAKSAHAQRLLQAIEKGLARDPSTIPKVENNNNQKQTCSPEATIDLLRVMLKYICKQHGVAPKLIASSADLEAIAEKDKAKVKALSGWRRKLFGNLALDVKHGRVSVCIEDGQIVIEPRQSAQPHARAAE